MCPCHRTCKCGVAYTLQYYFTFLSFELHKVKWHSCGTQILQPTNNLLSLLAEIVCMVYQVQLYYITQACTINNNQHRLSIVNKARLLAGRHQTSSRTEGTLKYGKANKLIFTLSDIANTQFLFLIFFLDSTHYHTC